MYVVRYRKAGVFIYTSNVPHLPGAENLYAAIISNETNQD